MSNVYPRLMASWPPGLLRNQHSRASVLVQYSYEYSTVPYWPAWLGTLL